MAIRVAVDPVAAAWAARGEGNAVTPGTPSRTLGRVASWRAKVRVRVSVRARARVKVRVRVRARVRVRVRVSVCTA